MPVRPKASQADGQDPGGCSTVTNHVPPAPPSAAVALSPRPASGSAIRVGHRFLQVTNSRGAIEMHLTSLFHQKPSSHWLPCLRGRFARSYDRVHPAEGRPACRPQENVTFSIIRQGCPLLASAPAHPGKCFNIESSFCALCPLYIDESLPRRNMIPCKDVRHRF